MKSLVRLAPPARLVAPIAPLLAALIGADPLSHVDRMEATRRTLINFAGPNVLTAIAMTGVYALRFSRPDMMIAALPVVLVVALGLRLIVGDGSPYNGWTPAGRDRMLCWYAFGLGISWFLLIGAIETAPLLEDRVGIACVTVAIICIGGAIFTLMPGPGLIFMAIVGARLATNLAMMVVIPEIYVIAIIAFVLMLTVLNSGQARLFTERMRAAQDLAALERRRADEAQRAADDQRALERALTEARAAEQARLAAEHRRTMAERAQRFETSVIAVVDALGEAVRALGRTTDKVIRMGDASAEHVGAVRARALVVGNSMASVQAAGVRLREAIAQIGREVNGQVGATETAAATSRGARAQAEALADSSRLVRGITAEIERIAQRTNTLALNALIEAAQSGEAGRGFAVVAGEVKALAAQTRAAAADIGRHIADMDGNAKTVVASVETIAGEVERIAAGARDIARAVSRQAEATDGISASVAHATDDAQAVEADLLALAEQASGAIGLARAIAATSEGIKRQSEALGAASTDFGAWLRAG